MFPSSTPPIAPGPSCSDTTLVVLNKEYVEAQPHVETTIPHAVLPAPPPAAYATHDASTAPTGLDGSLGTDVAEAHRLPSRTRDTMPPPYAPYGHKVVEVEQGLYTIQEPPTLARMLFYYGFLFFPFWLAGIYILVTPLLPTPDWEEGKTEDEKTHLLEVLRKTEKKWARRCLFAMLGFIVAVLLLVIIVKYGILGNI